MAAKQKVGFIGAGLTTAQKTGIDLKTFYDAIAAGGLDSGFFENAFEWMLHGDPKAHLFTLRNCGTDIGCYTRLADSAPPTALVANAVRQTYEIAFALGKGDLHMAMPGGPLAELNNTGLPKPNP